MFPGCDLCLFRLTEEQKCNFDEISQDQIQRHPVMMRLARPSRRTQAAPGTGPTGHAGATLQTSTERGRAEGSGAETRTRGLAEAWGDETVQRSKGGLRTARLARPLCVTLRCPLTSLGVSSLGE